jgi:hypothetical protein
MQVGHTYYNSNDKNIELHAHPISNHLEFLWLQIGGKNIV